MISKLKITFFFLLFNTGFAFAQKKQGQTLVDSLLTELPKLKEDTAKANLFNSISYSYQGINTNKCMIYARQALQLSTRLKWNKGIAMALNNIDTYYINKHELDSAINNLLNALDLGEKEKDMEIVCQSKIYLGFIYTNRVDDVKSMSYFNQALTMSKQLNNKLFEGYALYGIGMVYWDYSNYTKALEYFQKANKIAIDLDNALLTEYSFSNLGNVFFYYDAKKAFENYNKAVSICEKYGYKYDLGVILINLGIMYTDAGDYPRAMEANRKALAIYEQENEKDGIGSARGNIGYTYLVMQDYMNALPEIQKAIDYADYAPVSRQIDDLIDMLRVYKEAPDTILRKIGITPEAALVKALGYGNKALELAKKNTVLVQLSDSYKYLSETYEKQNDHAKALEAYKQYIVIRDSSFNQEKQKEITRKDMQYEFDKKQFSDSLHNAEIKKTEAFKLSRQKAYTYTAFAGIGLLLLLLFLIFRFYQKQKRSNLLLSKTLAELTETQHQLVKSEKMAAFGSLASRLAHEIQNPLNFVNNFSDLSTELVHEIMSMDSIEDREEAAKMLISNLEKINHHGKRADTFIKELLKHSREGTTHEYIT